MTIRKLYPGAVGSLIDVVNVENTLKYEDGTEKTVPAQGSEYLAQIKDAYEMKTCEYIRINLKANEIELIGTDKDDKEVTHKI